MATNIAAQIALAIIAQFNNSKTLGGASYPVNYGPNYQFTDGVGANQAKEIFTDIRTITASSTDDLDLSGVLLDAFGNTILFTKIKALIISADPTNTNDVVVGNAVSNQVATIFGAVTHTLKVKPGGMMALVAPDVNGYGITAATADILRITNGGAGTSVNYTIVAIGTV